jgi:hypothetical protein
MRIARTSRFDMTPGISRFHHPRRLGGNPDGLSYTADSQHRRGRRKLGLELVERVLTPTRIDLEQQVASLHVVVVDHRQLDDGTAHLRRTPNPCWRARHPHAEAQIHLRKRSQVGPSPDEERPNQRGQACSAGTCQPR